MREEKTPERLRSGAFCDAAVIKMTGRGEGDDISLCKKRKFHDVEKYTLL